MECPEPRWITAALIIVASLSIANAQRLPERTAQGSLTVTLTIASSVGIVIEPDGQEHLVAANTASAADNVSRIEYVQLSSAQRAERSHSADKRRKSQPSAKPNQ
jgi:hypothetical protein